jgi:hypothetical protein
LDDNIKIDFHEVRLGNLELIDPAADRGSWRVLVNVVMNLQVL